MNWIVVVVLALAFFLLASVAFVGWWSAGRNHDIIEDVLASKQAELEAIEAKHVNLLNEVRRQDAQRMEQCMAENANLREALQEAKVEIKALHMQTVEIEEVKPPRGSRGKKASETQ